MSTEPEDVLLDHAYDGIQEYDNPMPGWWVWAFIATIVFAPFYFFYYHMSGEDRGIYAELEDDLAAASSSGTQLAETNAALLGYLEDPEIMERGKAIFDTQCMPCHSPDGGGLVGPNLTDDYYKNIKRLGDIGGTVEDGVATTAMLGWRGRLHSNEIVMVSAYVASLRGTNVPGGLAPEGEVIQPWPEPPAESVVEPTE